jgi:hypothetical protein
MTEDIEKNIEALEKEKQEFLAGNLEEDSCEETEDVEEEINVDETEFSLTEEEIEEWIIKLTELKVEKNPVELEVDEKNVLKINFEEEE